MSKNEKCAIWETPATVSDQVKGGGFNVNSPRTGGRYMIADADNIIGSIDDTIKARLTTWLIDQRRLGVDGPAITKKVVDEARRRRPLPVYERADRLLQCLQTYLPTIASSTKIRTEEQRGVVFAWSESIDQLEVKYLLDFLEKKQLLGKTGHTSIGNIESTITPEGYAHLAELETKAVDSKQSFVAMWFDPAMNDVYEKAIKPGIIDAGYKPVRIDGVNHNNKIDDEIIAEIRRSRFLVADFTHGNSGMRGGVYYEAGFAHGLNIPVIFTCCENVIGEVHFDTRQYNHITWNPDQFEEFRTALANRISATIGDGPLKGSTTEAEE